MQGSNGHWGRGPKTEKHYVRCVRDVATGYPYVSEGKYIVSQDLDGSSGETLHAKWTSPTPSHNYEDAVNNTLSAKFEVAAADCDSNNASGVTPGQDTNKYTWEKAADACAAYAQTETKAGTTAGNWRLPTLNELQTIVIKKDELTGSFIQSLYWSATEDSQNNSNACSVPDVGYTWVLSSKDGNKPVRCVRDL